MADKTQLSTASIYDAINQNGTEGDLVIASGMNLGSLCNYLRTKYKMNVTPEEIAKYNHISNPNKIYPGQHITIYGMPPKEKSFGEKFTSFFTDNYEKVKKSVSNLFSSSTDNFETVKKYKKDRNITAPYWYLDRKNHVLYHMLMDKVLSKQDVSVGKFTESDAWNKWFYEDYAGKKDKPADFYKAMPANTPAGIYVAYAKANNNHYTEAPVIRLKDEKGKMIPTAFHGLAYQYRCDAFNRGERELSTGCISPAPGKMKELNNLMQIGDTVYMEPVMEGNHFEVLPNGKLTTVYTNAPKTITHTASNGKTYKNVNQYNGVVREPKSKLGSYFDYFKNLFN